MIDLLARNLHKFARSGLLVERKTFTFSKWDLSTEVIEKTPLDQHLCEFVFPIRDREKKFEVLMLSSRDIEESEFKLYFFLKSPFEVTDEENTSHVYCCAIIMFNCYE